MDLNEELKFLCENQKINNFFLGGGRGGGVGLGGQGWM